MHYEVCSILTLACQRIWLEDVCTVQFEFEKFQVHIPRLVHFCSKECTVCKVARGRNSPEWRTGSWGRGCWTGVKPEWWPAMDSPTSHLGVRFLARKLFKIWQKSPYLYWRIEMREEEFSNDLQSFANKFRELWNISWKWTLPPSTPARTLPRPACKFSTSWNRPMQRPWWTGQLRRMIHSTSTSTNFFLDALL